MLEALVKLASIGASGICIYAIFAVGRSMRNLPSGADATTHRTLRFYMVMCVVVAIIAAGTGIAEVGTRENTSELDADEFREIVAWFRLVQKYEVTRQIREIRTNLDIALDQTRPEDAPAKIANVIGPLIYASSKRSVLAHFDAPSGNKKLGEWTTQIEYPGEGSPGTVAQTIGEIMVDATAAAGFGVPKYLETGRFLDLSPLERVGGWLAAASRSVPGIDLEALESESETDVTIGPMFDVYVTRLNEKLFAFYDEAMKESNKRMQPTQ